MYRKFRRVWLVGMGGVVGALVVAAASGAQANGDFVGTWRIDLERSDAMNREGLKIAGTYTLALDGDNVQTQRTFEAQGQTQAIDWMLITDGKPHEIPGMRSPRKARAKWKKGKLTVSYTASFDTPRGAFDLDITETWKLNKDGELEILYATRMPNRTQTRTEIWVREGEG